MITTLSDYYELEMDFLIDKYGKLGILGDCQNKRNLAFALEILTLRLDYFVVSDETKNDFIKVVKEKIGNLGVENKPLNEICFVVDETISFYLS